MKCHGENRKNKRGHKQSPLKHMLHMVLCCGLPIFIVGLLPLISRFSNSGAKVLGGIVPFICPLMMIGMIVMMFRKNEKGNCCGDNGDTNSDKPELE